MTPTPNEVAAEEKVSRTLKLKPIDEGYLAELEPELDEALTHLKGATK